MVTKTMPTGIEIHTASEMLRDEDDLSSETGRFCRAVAIMVTSPSLDRVLPIEFIARQRYFKGCSVSFLKTAVSEDLLPF